LVTAFVGVATGEATVLGLICSCGGLCLLEQNEIMKRIFPSNIFAVACFAKFCIKLNAYSITHALSTSRSGVKLYSGQCKAFGAKFYRPTGRRFSKIKWAAQQKRPSTFIEPRYRLNRQHLHHFQNFHNSFHSFPKVSRFSGFLRVSFS